MMVNQHALDRAMQRFGIHGVDFIKNMVRKSRERFWVLDRHHSMQDGSQDQVRKEVVVDQKRRAYFVVHNHTVQTVLTEEQGMNALKRGKWTKLDQATSY